MFVVILRLLMLCIKPALLNFVNIIFITLSLNNVYQFTGYISLFNQFYIEFYKGLSLFLNKCLDDALVLEGASGRRLGSVTVLVIAGFSATPSMSRFSRS
jgi:hypothetical protein